MQFSTLIQGVFNGSVGVGEYFAGEMSIRRTLLSLIKKQALISEKVAK